MRDFQQDVGMGMAARLCYNFRVWPPDSPQSPVFKVCLTLDVLEIFTDFSSIFR